MEDKLEASRDISLILDDSAVLDLPSNSLSGSSVLSCVIATLLTGLFVSSRGRKTAPHRIQLSRSPVSIRTVPFQAYSSSSRLVRGAKRNVPKPEPQTARPVARDRLFSK